MENSKNLIDWSLFHKDKLKLEVIYYTGLRNYIPQIEDIGINISFKNKLFHGRGTDFNEDIAYCKAISECIERIAVDFYDIENSNGVAAHDSYEFAKINARNELIERDAFLCHFLLKGQFNLVSSKSFETIESNLVIEFYELVKNQLGTAIFATTKSDSSFFSFGISFSKNENEAIEKATIELLRDYDHFNRHPLKEEVSLEEFSKKINYTFHDHSQLSHSRKYLQLFHDNLLKYNDLKINLNYNESDFIFNSLCLDQFFPDCPLVIVQAINPNLQKLFVGPTTQDKVNLKRLQLISSQKMSFNDLNLLPHPID